MNDIVEQLREVFRIPKDAKVLPQVLTVTTVAKAIDEIERLRSTIHEALNELFLERYDRAERILREGEG